ncbi:MAG: L-erythro-3,5-diaminohexanoate dehydrogenase [Acholeplasmataceae bacterium]|jgi:L-erythro-3,5-diaminohexanoate dehydrogenase|nr:L-erythro-3,5-diaminohexanoate dehydrogenase [Acholeplasmataceae bacterium]
MKTFSRYGIHRVTEPVGGLPQAALKLDPTPVCYPPECLIEVDVLNIDSASFHQIKEACHSHEEDMKNMILSIVNGQGKMQNPVTKSGGMLIGTVKEIGSDFNHPDLKIGMKIATLVSLSLTPLHIEEIVSINLKNEQVKIKGQAILFDSGIYAVIPSDLDEKLVLAALDVCGAPAQVQKLAKKDQTVLIIGAAGKSGLLCAYVAKQQVGPNGRVIALVNETTQKDLLEQLGYADDIILESALNSVAVYEKVANLTHNELADLTINVVNVENTEMTSILSTKNDGIVYFFSMATSFTKAALGAEGISKDVTMIIGNGYTKNHAEITLNLLRENKILHDLFMKRYAGE